MSGYPHIYEKFIFEKPPKLEKLEIKEKHEKIEKLEHFEKAWYEGPLKGVAEGPQELNPGEVEARLAAIETAVAELRHFIRSDDRPDLSEGPLAGEDR